MVSSYLGETAANLRSIFETAGQSPCLLFIDECDSIAKSRMASQEVGEIKRIVNSFLQLLDDYDAPGLMVCATNLDSEEVLTKPLKDGNVGLADQYLAFISTFPNLGLREIDQNVAFLAAKLRARYGIKTPEALFLATAMEEKAEAFITNDVRLLGIENIEIVLIKDFA